MRHPEGVPLKRVTAELKKLYRPPRTFLTNWNTPFELLIAAILSTQSPDKVTNNVTSTLFQKYPTPKAFAEAPLDELWDAVRPCAPYRTKVVHIQETCRLLLEKFGGEVPRTMEELLQFPGVGRKVASVVLWGAYQLNEGIGIDTHVQRVAKRLGLSMAKSPQRIELDLMEQAPQREWGNVHTLLISHGRTICTARYRKCERCVFQLDCPSSRMMARDDLADERIVEKKAKLRERDVMVGSEVTEKELELEESGIRN
jgi:endonuclease III